jgi:competence protein ComEA
VGERPRSTIAIWLVAAVLAVIAGMRLLGGAHEAPPSVSLDRAPGTSRASERHAQVYVHVAGAVRRAGLFRVPSGARVAAALARAGGPTRRADLTLVNLAAKVEDGQQILVPVKGAATGAGPVGAAGASGSSPGAAAPPGARIHLSSATPEQLDEIDGIGPTLAGRIVEYRDAHGGFRSIDQLAQVDGIGEKRLATLRDALQP